LWSDSREDFGDGSGSLDASISASSDTLVWGTTIGGLMVHEVEIQTVLAASALILHVIAARPQAQALLFSYAKAAGSRGSSLESARANAPHIFNAVHSSMRQWGSSLKQRHVALSCKNTQQHSPLP
jgi:hypothetical protein